MHCSSRQPDATQSLSPLFSSPVPSLNSLSLSVAVLALFYCSFVTLPCDLELWPRDLDLWPWPWTYVVHGLHHGRTLYEIWAKSDNPRRSFCSLNIWPYDLEHCITCCAMLWDSLHKAYTQSRYEFMKCYDVFDANTPFHAMTLTFELLTLKVCGRSGDLSLIHIWRCRRRG